MPRNDSTLTLCTLTALVALLSVGCVDINDGDSGSAGGTQGGGEGGEGEGGEGEGGEEDGGGEEGGGSTTPCEDACQSYLDDGCSFEGGASCAALCAMVPPRLQDAAAECIELRDGCTLPQECTFQDTTKG